MKQIQQRQQSLNQQLKKMKEDMEKGQQQQGKRNSMNEQFARMAAEQEAIRRALGQYMQELQKQGLKDAGQLSELMKQMEKTEEELVNKIISNNTLKRQVGFYFPNNLRIFMAKRPRTCFLPLSRRNCFLDLLRLKCLSKADIRKTVPFLVTSKRLRIDFLIFSF